MSKKEEICRLYYERHLTQDEIAKRLEVSQPYISKVINQDNRRKEEEEQRHQESKKHTKEYQANYQKTYIRPKKEDTGYIQMKAQLEKDAKILSRKANISDLVMSNWNRGMYEYDKNSSDLVLKKGITVTIDIAKRISNIVNPDTIKQKYKCQI